eukprot:TRINITY_DN3216_c0_g1_i13.p2 TRINITY_DN3216_c0_g1~~TRINITY_DN3216_c0_g1_i13.p2  ORF type:complete len:160 (+),score=32.73 TRINITY_DN3216_c0_g1_i13:1136-1615(+)
MNPFSLPQRLMSNSYAHGYLERMKKQTSEVLARAERFINPATTQELFFTDQEVYLYNEHGYLVPLSSIRQIKRCSKPHFVEVEETPNNKFSPALTSFGDVRYLEGDSIFSPLGGTWCKAAGHLGSGFPCSAATSPIQSLFHSAGSTGAITPSPYVHTPM